MIFRTTFLVASAIGLLTATFAMADSDNLKNKLQPGLWSATSEGIWYAPNGDKTPIPKTIADLCISTQTADDLLTKLPVGKRDCSIEILARDESRLVVRAFCTDGTKIHHTMRWTPTSYEIESYIKMSSQGYNATSDVVTTGKYLGPCKNETSPPHSDSE